MKSSELPVNLSEFSWAGSLPKKIFTAYPKHVLGMIGIVTVVALMAAALVYVITGDERHLWLALPVSTWFWTIGLLVIYGVTTRDVRIMRPGLDGRYLLDTGKWFKNAVHPYREADTLYENGKRVLWLHELDGEVVPLDVWSARERRQSGNPATAAQIAGIKSYTESVAVYAFKKTMTLQDQIKIGILAAIIAVLLIGMFMMSGRLTDDPVDATQSQAAASSEA